MTVKQALEAVFITPTVQLKVFDASFNSYDLPEVEAAPYSNGVFVVLSGLPRVAASRAVSGKNNRQAGSLVVTLHKRFTGVRLDAATRLTLANEVANLVPLVHDGIEDADEFVPNIKLDGGGLRLVSESDVTEFNKAYAPVGTDSLNIAYWQSTRYEYQIGR